LEFAGCAIEVPPGLCAGGICCRSGRRCRMRDAQTNIRAADMFA
jgi:hypothetical protein